MTHPEEGRQEDETVSALFANNCADEVLLWNLGENASDDRRRFQWLAVTMARYIKNGGTRADGLREAAEIARGSQQQERELADRLDEELGEAHSATMAFRERHTAVRLVAEAIESKLAEGER